MPHNGPSTTGSGVARGVRHLGQPCPPDSGTPPYTDSTVPTDSGTPPYTDRYSTTDSGTPPYTDRYNTDSGTPPYSTRGTPTVVYLRTPPVVHRPVPYRPAITSRTPTGTVPTSDKPVVHRPVPYRPWTNPWYTDRTVPTMDQPVVHRWTLVNTVNNGQSVVNRCKSPLFLMAFTVPYSLAVLGRLGQSGIPWVIWHPGGYPWAVPLRTYSTRCTSWVYSRCTDVNGRVDR